MSDSIGSVAFPRKMITQNNNEIEILSLSLSGVCQCEKERIMSISTHGRGILRKFSFNVKRFARELSDFISKCNRKFEVSTKPRICF